MTLVVVGVGRWGRNHVRVAKELQREGLVELKAVVDIDAERARTVAEEFGVPAYFTDCSEAFEKIKPDAAIVAVPIPSLYPVAKIVLEHGVNVLVEKPVSTTVSQATELRELARRKGVVAIPGFIMRFNPVVRKVKELVPEVDPLYAVFRRLSRRPPAARAVSIMYDLAIHDIDLCRYVLDYKGSLKLHSFSLLKVGEDEIFTATVLAGETPCVLHVDGVSPSKVREIELIGGRAMVRGDTDYNVVTIRRPDWSYVTEKLVSEEPLKLEVKAFIRAVSGLEEDVPNLDDAVEALKVVEAVLRSKRVGEGAS